jgi:tetrathionate reductase subunit B
VWEINGENMNTENKEAKEVSANEILTRRKFLKRAVAIVAVSAATTAASGSSPLKKYYDNFPKADEMEKRWAMVIDLRRCIGCQSCAVACKTENNVPLGVFRAWVQNIEKGNYPNVKVLILPAHCNHCDNPPCVSICPVKATYKRGDGAVLINKAICIGCGFCIQACPYDSRFFNPESRTADKCTFCDHRIGSGLEPACISACPTRARIFGDLNEKTSEVAKLAGTIPTQVLKPEKGSKPMVLYISLDNDIEGPLGNNVKVLGGGD